jgi:transposase-like protein
MDEYPKTPAEFDALFGSEAACREYLMRLRWPEGIACPECQGVKVWRTKRELMMCADCGRQLSVTAGTIFQDTRKPLSLWFRAMWYVTGQKTGTSAMGLQRILGLASYRTAWTWLHKLRRAMVRPGRDRLSGTVEVDETYVGGPREGKRGRGASGKSLVLIAAEIEGTRTGRIRLMRIPDASGDSLGGAIRQSIEPGSIIQTDGWAGYRPMEAMGYRHQVVRATEELGDNLLPHCHRAASLLKRWMLGTHQGAISHEHLEYYLDEFTFRFNRRTSRHRGKLFYRLVQQAVAVEPQPYKKMVRHARGRQPGKHKP